MNIARRIKYFRSKQGLTQKDFGEKLGFSQGYIADLERGRQEPSREFLKRIYTMWGISADYFLYGTSSDQWHKIEAVLRLERIPQEVIDKVKSNFSSDLLPSGKEKYQKGIEKGMKVFECATDSMNLDTATKKLINDVIKILKTCDKVTIGAPKANVLVLELTKASKREDKKSD